MSDNLKIWDQLKKTDPSQTKKFKRAGGFTGTAIKPIYQLQKMTETFGMAGEGWGTGEPTFQVVTGVNQEILVFCTVGLWVKTEGSPDHWVWGVGGDKVVSYVKANDQYNRPERWENDDEAFKKAFTDALGNALKHLGMSADVHMGLFDDSKYVREREEEARNASQSHTEAQAEPLEDSLAKKLFPTIQSDLQGCATRAQLDGCWQRWVPLMNSFSELMQENCDSVFQQMKDYLAEHDNDARAANADIIEADLRAAMSMDDLKAKWSGWGPAMKKLAPTDVVKLSEAKEQVKKAIIGIGKMPDFTALKPSEAGDPEGAELARAEKAARLAGTP